MQATHSLYSSGREDPNPTGIYARDLDILSETPQRIREFRQWLDLANEAAARLDQAGNPLGHEVLVAESPAGEQAIQKSAICPQ